MCDFIASDRTSESTIHEITWQLPNGDWQYQRHYGLTYQGACRLGLWGAGDGSEKTLTRVERLPDHSTSIPCYVAGKSNI